MNHRHTVTYCWWFRNLAPPDMYKNPASHEIFMIFTISTGERRISEPSTVFLGEIIQKIRLKIQPFQLFAAAFQPSTTIELVPSQRLVWMMTVVVASVAYSSCILNSAKTSTACVDDSTCQLAERHKTHMKSRRFPWFLHGCVFFFAMQRQLDLWLMGVFYIYHKCF